MPVSSTAIRAPLPSLASALRLGSAFGPNAGRTVEPGPPWMRGSPMKLIASAAVPAASPTNTWLGATHAGPCLRLAVALRM